ncbi:HEAT repeat domain-containing protein [bacterium]|nr:MAG: HEAT repeat domain-containing protein [bacterium]
MRIASFLLFLAFSGCTSLNALPVAQAQTVPALSLKTEPQVVLTPEFIRDSDYILVGILSADRNNPKLLRVGMRDAELIRGDSRSAGRGLLVSEADLPTIPVNKKSIILGNYNPGQDQVLISARLEPTPENIARVTELAAAHRKLKFRFFADKATYGSADTIKLTWEIENTSSVPQRIYVGQYSIQYSSVYDGRSHSTGTGGSHNRKPEDYKTLAPGEKWTTTREVKGPFPEGQVGIEMVYESMDNFLGSDSNRRQAKERVESVTMVKETIGFQVDVKPPSADEKKALLTKLGSTNWSEAMEAATLLAELKGIESAPELQTLAKHPWPALRVKALRGVSGSATWSPTLRALLFDRDRRVRQAALDLISRRNIPGASVSVLALLAVEEEARKGGFSDSKSVQSSVEMILTRAKDKSVGDLIAARLERGNGMQDGFSAAYVLNYIADNARELRLPSDKIPTDEEKAAVLAAWKAVPKNEVKFVTAAELDAETAAARKAVYGDFKVTPDWAKVVEAIRGLKTTFWPAPTDVNRQALEALPTASRPDVLGAIRWLEGPRYGTLENAPPLRIIAQIEEPLARGAAFEYLLARAYDGVKSDSPFYIDGDTKYLAVILLGKMDFAKAKPHLEYFLNVEDTRLKLGAAVALAASGDKRGVPFIFKNPDDYSFLDFEDAAAALSKATGQTFPNTYEWKKWWQETGSKQDWK